MWRRSRQPLEPDHKVAWRNSESLRHPIQRILTLRMLTHVLDKALQPYLRPVPRSAHRRINDRQQERKHRRTEPQRPVNGVRRQAVILAEQLLEQVPHLVRAREKAVRQVRQRMDQGLGLVWRQAQQGKIPPGNPEQEPVLAHALGIRTQPVHVPRAGNEHRAGPEGVGLLPCLERQVAAQAKRNLKAFVVHVERRLRPPLAVAVVPYDRQAQDSVRLQRQDAPLGRIHVVERQPERSPFPHGGRLRLTAPGSRRPVRRPRA